MSIIMLLKKTRVLLKKDHSNISYTLLNDANGVFNRGTESNYSDISFRVRLIS